MASVLDFLFGKKPLEKAAAQGSQTPPPQAPSSGGNYDAIKAAAEEAGRRTAAEKAAKEKAAPAKPPVARPKQRSVAVKSNADIIAGKK